MGKPDTPPKKRRLGLAQRVVVLACLAAIAATVAQWAVAPFIMHKQLGHARLMSAGASAQQLALLTAAPLERGDAERVGQMAQLMSDPKRNASAVVLDSGGRVAGASVEGPGSLLELVPVSRRSHAGVFKLGANYVGVVPVESPRGRLGTAIVAIKPRPILHLWLTMVAVNALILVLALGVIAPFFLPLARRVLAPLTDLERRIRSRAPGDSSALAEESQDPELRPLMQAIDDAHRQSEAKTRRALQVALADPVTRLPNRLRFMSRLDSLLNSSPAGACLAICDLDGFRKINVSLGPRIADRVLAGVGARLKACAETVSGDRLYVGRLSADQFAVMCSDGWGPLEEFIQRAQRAISEPMPIEGEVIRLSASFGSAMAEDRSAADLMKRAETALKEAKRAPGNSNVKFDERLQVRTQEQASLEAGLRDGLDRGEFVAVFQPKVKLETGELVGAEALARWRRPDGSVVSPGRFIPIAEELGLISKLGNSVMRDACMAAAQWNRGGAVATVAVNVSPFQLDDPDFTSVVNRALEEANLDPRLLELEITESAAVGDPDRVARIMWPLRHRGVRLAIDDFGTGHSNFNTITRLPFDVVKIDQQFVSALTTDANAPAIIEMILAMSEALGQTSVAEGVETREQADFLLRRACDYGQGYHFSPPLPVQEFDAFVRAWRPRAGNRFAA